MEGGEEIDGAAGEVAEEEVFWVGGCGAAAAAAAAAAVGEEEGVEIQGSVGEEGETFHCLELE